MDDRRGGERGSGISVLMVRHDDDDDDDSTDPVSLDSRIHRLLLCREVRRHNKQFSLR